MAALEYLTSNSLTSYPLKSGRVLDGGNNHPIEDDWFYDVLFTSYSNSIRSVYISKIKKTASGSLEVTFANSESLASLGVATIAANALVNHYKNIDKSFASYSSATFAVKFVLGPGLITKSSFEQSYSLAEAELSNSAIILNAPRLDQLTFEAYTFNYTISTSPTIEEVAAYVYPEVPTVQPRYNSSFTLEAINSGSLQVLRGAGAGLYDDCPVAGAIQDVYSLNNVLPNDKGALFLNASSCYAANVLSESNETLYGTYLDKYRLFEVHTSPTSSTTKDVVHVGHSITFENFCKPKCPHENLNAFAHYLNRVSDGAQDLDTAVSKAIETRGQGDNFLKVFTASEFCVTGDDVFARCSDPADLSTYVECGNSFIKNYHEGRTLQLYYDSLTVRNYKITEVIDAFTVRLDNIPPPAQNSGRLSFRVLDNGIISNLNCAALAYNQNAESFLKTYYKVTYSTNEAYNPNGVYSTNLAVVVALYNPSPTTAEVRVDFTPTILTQTSGYKVRTADSIYTVDSPELTIACRDYAFIETVFSISCATPGGFLDIIVSEKLNGIWTMVGETYSLPEIVGAACLETTGGGGGTTGGTTTLNSSARFRVTQQSGIYSTETINLPTGTTRVSTMYGPVPSWLTYAFSATARTLTLGVSSAPLENKSQTYILYFKSFASTTTTLWQLTLDYIAYPEIISPLASRFSVASPLLLSSETVYTNENPAFQIFATNMSISSQISGDIYNYSIYSELGLLPEGLIIDGATGKVTGQLSAEVVPGSNYSIRVNATNPSGNASNPQTIYLRKAAEYPPVLSLISPPEDEVYLVSNLETYTTASPLVAFSVTNTPIYNYTLQGNLPTGLYFNRTTGSITGKIAATSSGSSEILVHTANVYGQSNVVSLTITYTIRVKPQITYPTASQAINISVNDETTLESPLFTVAALQAYGGSDNFAAGLTNDTRNRYLAAGIPEGFTLDLYTGKFYGKLASSQLPANTSGRAYTLPYTLILGAYNPVGGDSRSITIYFSSEQAPVILDPSLGETISIVKEKNYTTSSPLLALGALNSPDSFTITGLPPGLTHTSSGVIIGKVNLSASAGTYEATATATNEYGESPAVKLYFSVPISLLSPEADSQFTATVFAESSTIFNVEACDILGGDSAILTVTDLPEGFSFSGGIVSGASTELGTHTIKVTASSSLYGTATSYVTLNISPVSYSVSGTVLDGDGNPVEEVLISDGRGRSTATDEEGKYTLYGLQAGSYNILPSSNSYSVIPRFIRLQVGAADCIGIDFTAEQSTRLIRGLILNEDFAGIAGIVVTSGTHEATTDSFGRYELYVLSGIEVEIIPKSTTYVFDPASGTVPAGTDGIEDADFAATLSRAASAPSIASITPGDKSLTLSFTAPEENGFTPITNYEYSTDSGVTWTAASPAKTTSPIVITSNATSTEVKDLVNGTSYGVSLRAVNAYGGGVPSIIISASPATTSKAPSITSHIVGPTGASIYFTAPEDNGGAAILSYEYSTDDGVTYISTNGNSSPASISGLVTGETYQVRLRAVNSIGKGTPTATYSLFLADAPDAPTITSVVVGDSQVSVYFDLPLSTGGVPLTNIGYSIDRGYLFNYPDPPSTTSPITIANLQNGISYYIVLKAINAAGNYSADSEASLATPAAIPDAPTELEVLSSDKALTISFVAPGNAISINNYKYQLNSGDWITLSPPRTGSPITIKNLINGTSYSVKLKATTPTGDGEESEAILGIPANPPSAPTLTEVSQENTALTITFTKSTELGGLSLQEYRYSTDLGRTFAVATVTDLSETQGKFTISGLTNGTSYTVYLAAKTAAGQGKSSNPLTGTPRTTATAPTQLTISSTTKTSATFRFTPPTSAGGAVITNYKYQLNDLLWSAIAPATVNSPITINNLTAGDKYDLKIRAVNAAGDGEISSSLVFTPVAPPSAPVLKRVISNDQRLQLLFTPPESDGGVPVFGYEYSLDGGLNYSLVQYLNTGASTNDSSELPYILIFDLINGKSYDVFIRAINSAGPGEKSATLRGSPVGPPPPPTLTGISGTPTGAKIQFTPPNETGGAAITNYAYSATIADGLEILVTPNPATITSPLVITGLTPGLLYSFKLYAINSYGVGEASQTITVTPGAPSAPTITKIVGSDEKIIVNFTAPTETGGTSITDYLYSTDDGASYSPARTTTSPIIIDGLINEKAYNLKIVAVNSSSVSVASNTVVAKPSNVPSAPKITGVTTQEATVAVYFTPPSSSGGTAIAGYKYSLDGLIFKPTDSTDSPINISGLITGASYDIYLLAFNSSVDGLASAPVRVTVGAPGAPVINYISATNSAVEINFTPPEDSGSPLLNHEYSLNSSATWVPLDPPITEGPIILTSQLSLNVRYSIRIRATNSRGAGPASLAASVGKGLNNVPVIDSVQPADGTLILDILAPGNHSKPIVDYKYNIYTDVDEGIYVPFNATVFPITSLTIPQQ